MIYEKDIKNVVQEIAWLTQALHRPRAVLTWLQDGIQHTLLDDGSIWRWDRALNTWQQNHPPITGK